MPPSAIKIPCPDERQWDMLAAGLIPGEQIDAMLEHAVGCDACAELLRGAIAVFRTGNQVQEMPVRSRRTLWVPLAIAAAIVAGLGLYIFQQHPGDPLAQLAGDYTKERPFEPRIPGAAYGPLRVERGARAANAELDDIGARITSAIQREPGNAAWLHARGRLELIRNNPGAAVESLRASQAAGGGSTALQIDLACAEYELALRRPGDPSNLGVALDLLGQVLEKEPGNSVALFNRALVFEQLRRLEDAARDLENVLAKEPAGPWRDEAQRILARVRAAGNL